MPPVRNLDLGDRLTLAEEMIQSVSSEKTIDGEVLDLVATRADHFGWLARGQGGRLQDEIDG